MSQSGTKFHSFGTEITFTNTQVHKIYIMMATTLWTDKISDMPFYI